MPTILVEEEGEEDLTGGRSSVPATDDAGGADRRCAARRRGENGHLECIDEGGACFCLQWIAGKSGGSDGAPGGVHGAEEPYCLPTVI